MDFLKEGEGERGTARAFLFENLMKSMLLIVDEVICNYDKYAKDQVTNAIRKIQVRL